MAAIGVDLFNPFQPEVMDVEETFAHFHGRLSFWGGISTQRLLPYGEALEVERQVERLLQMGLGGGYVIAPAHSVPRDARVENVKAMLRLIMSQGRYS